MLTRGQRTDCSGGTETCCSFPLRRDWDRGINDEAGMIILAQERGWKPADTKAALDDWVQRMGQSMAVGSSSARSSVTDGADHPCRTPSATGANVPHPTGSTDAAASRERDRLATSDIQQDAQ
jgi:hypothetical protein